MLPRMINLVYLTFFRCISSMALTNFNIQNTNLSKACLFLGLFTCIWLALLLVMLFLCVCAQEYKHEIHKVPWFCTLKLSYMIIRC
ncbi:hypothetical protein J3Q64DRAFT_1776533 [Phycomyces blakesleeanus]|uniref:Uncharacterized protein n=1 Tax=Phycomyces blakesleeanus TaxID=4837 RepID=A0ABR3AJH4_PHYBL